MTRATVVLATLLVLITMSGIASAQDQGQIDRGMKVYADQKCALCHAIGGKGNSKGTLDSVGSRLKADDIREWITNPAEMAQKAKAERKPAMKASTASTEDIDAMVAYLVTLKKK